MARTPLTHNPLNGVTAAIWRDGDMVHKVLSGRRRDAPSHWAASDEPRHWNAWRREALVHEHGLPQRLGLAAPRLVELREQPDGDVELVLEHVAGRTGAELTIDDLELVAVALGRAQGRPGLGDEPWLSRGFLRSYSTTRPVDWSLLEGDSAWARPLMREHFPPELRTALLDFHASRDALLALAERLPRALCHLDVWPCNIIMREGREPVFLDWSFTGDGALGEDVGNLVPDAVFDLLLPHAALPELDERLTRGYVAGLREAGWTGDERLARLSICAAAVKYDWLTAFCLEHARAQHHVDYGGAGAVDADARYAARAAGLSRCAAWGQEALVLAKTLGV
jgi:hypothetical protein